MEGKNRGNPELESRLREIIDRELSDVSGGFVCPVCGSDDAVKCGTTSSGTQRWKCRACGSVRCGTPEGRILSNTKLPRSTWMSFIPLFLARLSCDKVAAILGVCHKTAWFMRVRLLEAVYDILPSFRAEKETVGVEGIYFRESFKGVGNTGSVVPGERFCVMATDDGDGFLYDVACRGSLDSYSAENSLVRCVTIGAVEGPDSVSAEVRQEKESRIREAVRTFMEPFRGVSSKWLHLYMAWFKFTVNSADAAVVSERISEGDYVHTWRDIGMMYPTAVTA